MPASKKSATKAAAKSPAPATKAPAKSASKPTAAAKPAAAKPVSAKPAAKKKAVAAAMPAPEPLPATPTVKAVAAKPITTTIAAQIDIGFGNALYLRGEGPGLSWEQGVKMQCVADDRWELTLGESARPFAFKFLVNDTAWCEGADYTVASGETTVLVPTFE